MSTRTKKPVESMQCQECLQTVSPPAAFHPYLYCLLYKNGIRNQEQYLRDSGFVREQVGGGKTDAHE